MSTGTVGASLRRGRLDLEAAGVPEPERNAQLLLCHLLGIEPGELALRLTETLDSESLTAYRRLLRERETRTPLQHILGSWEFYGLPLTVDGRALIPRGDTETLVEVTLASLGDAPAVVCDVGTGSGCVAIALAMSRPELELHATDVSEEALTLAATNVARHDLGERVALHLGDLLEPLGGTVEPGALDAVVSNPPYIAAGDLAALEPEVRDHDPRLALVGGDGGLEIVCRLIAQAAAWLTVGGLLAIEIGDRQGQEARSSLEEHGGYEEITLWPDLGGLDRVVTARRIRD